MAEELKGRVALVTGAGRNIGRAIALALASAGASVVANARSSQAEIDAVAAETGGLAVLADVTDEQAVARMVARALERFGRIDILVNNAAIRAVEPIEGISLARWREVTGVILDGAWNCSHACAEALEAASGTIVNIGGMSAHTGALGRPHVVAAKAGLVGLTRALAHDLAPRVTVNCVVPGMIDTNRGASSGASAHQGRRESPLGRRGTPDEVAAAVRFLAGPGARYITGQTLHVNGGAYSA
ncbi:MAG TPA: SDR family oxidoreductase [Burkholderiales bacterium]|nr:SDR family oxidoreductase [Burkholderiales bacterium]